VVPSGHFIDSLSKAGAQAGEAGEVAGIDGPSAVPQHEPYQWGAAVPARVHQGAPPAPVLQLKKAEVAAATTVTKAAAPTDTLSGGGRVGHGLGQSSPASEVALGRHSEGRR
jgi:hypothetical protein